MSDILEKILKVNKPWGNFEQFTLNQNSTVKIITVNKGQRLSLQRHKNREELWIALDNGLTAEIDGTLNELNIGEKVFIKKGQTHRISSINDGARFLEISLGEFDENDIERLEDDYGRD